MIKIELNDEIIKNHWEWFENTLLDNVKTTILADRDLKKRFGFTKPNFDSKIQSLIVGDYNTLEKWIKKLGKFSSSFNSENYEKLKKIFNYDKFSADDTWGAYGFVNALNLSVCPYCNRSYIHTVVNGKIRPELDHFFVKSQYPYLAVSIYNLVPSCHICNKIKHTKDVFPKNKRIIHPYSEEFGNSGKFKTDLYGFNLFSNMRKNSLDFDIILDYDENTDLGKKISASKDTFRLDRLYKFHKDYVKEIIDKRIMYDESRIDELYNEYTGLFGSKEELIQTIFGSYIQNEDLGKRPLSKLAKDILEEYGFFEEKDQAL